MQYLHADHTHAGEEWDARHQLPPPKYFKFQ